MQYWLNSGGDWSWFFRHDLSTTKKKKEDMKRKEKREKKRGEKWAHPQLSIIKRERQRNFIWERESARTEVSTTYLKFFMRCIRGEVNCKVPFRSPLKNISNCLLYPSRWKILILPPFRCSQYFSTGSVFPPPPPPSPFPFRCNVCIHSTMISLF